MFLGELSSNDYREELSSRKSEENSQLKKQERTNEPKILHHNLPYDSSPVFQGFAECYFF